MASSFFFFSANLSFIFHSSPVFLCDFGILFFFFPFLQWNSTSFPALRCFWNFSRFMILCRSLPQKAMIIMLIIPYAHILCCHLQPLWSCYLFPDPGAPQGVQVHFGSADHYVCQWKLLALISALDGSERKGRMGNFSSHHFLCLHWIFSQVLSQGFYPLLLPLPPHLSPLLIPLHQRMNSPSPNPIPTVCPLPVPPARVTFCDIKGIAGPVLIPSPAIHLKMLLLFGYSKCRSIKCFYIGKDWEEMSQKLGKLFCFSSSGTHFHWVQLRLLAAW